MLLNYSEIGSPATLHKNLKSLVDLQLVDIITDKIDFRMKLVSPTRRAMDKLKELESFLHKP
jgi:DNA-binding MarR family transcriptional regulator